MTIDEIGWMGRVKKCKSVKENNDPSTKTLIVPTYTNYLFYPLHNTMMLINLSQSFEISA